MRRQIAQYEIISEVGHGGMATVYRAHDPERQCDVAIKVLRRDYLTDLGFRARFEREAAVITALEHEAIVPVYEFGQSEGQLYIVMAYMPHGSLAQRLGQAPLALETTAKILARIGAALDYAHSRGVVHRDLKPSNILFDAGDEPYLADFGIAVQPETGEPGNVEISGTPAYMSPEQARREREIDGATDLYALGVTMFQVLTGQLPFNAETPMAILVQHIHQAPPSPGTIAPELPPGLEPVLLKALAKDPRQRYRSATEFVAGFQKALDRAPDAKDETRTAEKGPVAGTEPTVAVAASSERQSQLPVPVSPAADKRGAWITAVRRETARHIEAVRIRLADTPVVALGFVTGLGILCALASVLAMRGPTLVESLRADASFAGITVTRSQSTFFPVTVFDPATKTPSPSPTPTAPAANVRMVHSDGMLTLINISGESLSLANVALRRVDGDGSPSPLFAANAWRRVAGGTVNALPAGDCLQVLRTDVASAAGPRKPNECNTLRGWLATRETNQLFQGADGDDFFQALQENEPVATCGIAAGSCQFYVSPP